MAAGTDAPDDGSDCSIDRRPLVGGRVPLRGGDAGRAHGAGAMSRPSGSWVRPPPRCRVGSRGSECQRVILRRGSRRGSRHGLPRSTALPVAFPSHKNGRSQIASLSPLDRQSRRPSGGRPAEPSTLEIRAINLPVPSSLSHGSSTGRLRRPSSFAEFLKSRRATARGLC